VAGVWRVCGGCVVCWVCERRRMGDIGVSQVGLVEAEGDTGPAWCCAMDM
jgi:hypothetical protein